MEFPYDDSRFDHLGVFRKFNRFDFICVKFHFVFCLFDFGDPFHNQKNGKAKKQFLLMAAAVVVVVMSASFIPHDQKETKVEATQVKKQAADDAEKKQRQQPN